MMSKVLQLSLAALLEALAEIKDSSCRSVRQLIPMLMRLLGIHHSKFKAVKYIVEKNKNNSDALRRELRRIVLRAPQPDMPSPTAYCTSSADEPVEENCRTHKDNHATSLYHGQLTARRDDPPRKARILPGSGPLVECQRRKKQVQSVQKNVEGQNEELKNQYRKIGEVRLGAHDKSYPRNIGDSCKENLMLNSGHSNQTSTSSAVVRHNAGKGTAQITQSQQQIKVSISGSSSRQAQPLTDNKSLSNHRIPRTCKTDRSTSIQRRGSPRTQTQQQLTADSSCDSSLNLESKYDLNHKLGNLTSTHIATLRTKPKKVILSSSQSMGMSVLETRSQRLTPKKRCVHTPIGERHNHGDANTSIIIGSDHEELNTEIGYIDDEAIIIIHSKVDDDESIPDSTKKNGNSNYLDINENTDDEMNSSSNASENDAIKSDGFQGADESIKCNFIRQDDFNDNDQGNRKSNDSNRLTSNNVGFTDLKYSACVPDGNIHNQSPSHNEERRNYENVSNEENQNLDSSHYHDYSKVVDNPNDPEDATNNDSASEIEQNSIYIRGARTTKEHNLTTEKHSTPPSHEGTYPATRTEENRTARSVAEMYISTKRGCGYVIRKEFQFEINRGDETGRIFESKTEAHKNLLRAIKDVEPNCSLKFHTSIKEFGPCNAYNIKPNYSFLIKCSNNICKLYQKLVYFEGYEEHPNRVTLFLLEKHSGAKPHPKSERDMRRLVREELGKKAELIGTYKTYFGQPFSDPDEYILLPENIQKVKDRQNQASVYHAHPMIDVQITLDAFEKGDKDSKQLKGYIQHHETKSRTIILQSEGEVRELGKCDEVVIHLDCTGSLIRERGPDNEQYLYHAAVFQRPNSKTTLTAISMLSQKNTTEQIKAMLSMLVSNFRKVHHRSLYVQEIVTDHSYCNMHAIVGAFNLGALSEYLDKLWCKSSDELVGTPIMKLCYSHLMNDVKYNAKKHLGLLQAKERRPIMRLFAEMADATDRESLCNAYRKLATILENQFLDEDVETVINDNTDNIKMDQMECGDEIKVPRKDPARTSYRDRTKAGQTFSAIAGAVRETVSREGVNRNPVYAPKLNTYFLTYVMPFASLWSSLHGRRKTNGLVEGWHKIVKQDILRGKKKRTAGDFIREMYARTNERVAESASEIRAKRKRKCSFELKETWSKRKKGSKGSYTTPTRNIDLDKDEVEQMEESTSTRPSCASDETTSNASIANRCTEEVNTRPSVNSVAAEKEQVLSASISAPTTTNNAFDSAITGKMEQDEFSQDYNNFKKSLPSTKIEKKTSISSLDIKLATFRKGRRRKLPVPNSTKVEVMHLKADEGQCCKLSVKKKHSSARLTLKSENKRRILGNRWFSSDDLDLFVQLLMEAAPDIRVHSPLSVFTPDALMHDNEPFIQIINTSYSQCRMTVESKGYEAARGSGSHWQVLTNVLQCDSDVTPDATPVVYLLCSLQAQPGNDVKVFIKKLYEKVAPKVILKCLSCQTQQDSSSCGAYACAFAASAVFAHNPGLLKYDNSKIRQHVYDSLKTQCLRPFPTTRSEENWIVKNGLEYGLYGRRVRSSEEIKTRNWSRGRNE